MKRIFLIRHGESLANIRFHKDTEEYIFDGDIPLTDNGIMQSKESAKFIKQYCIDNNINLNDSIMWVSPFLRASNTAEYINEELGIEKVYIDPKLSEMDFGLFDQRDPIDCNNIDKRIHENIGYRSKSTRGKFYAKRPNGESPADVYTRMSTFIETLYRDNEQNIFIVSHGIALRVLLMRLMHYNLEWYYNEENSGNASIRLIERDPINDLGYIYTPANQADKMYDE